jgi:hypothetical protein
MAEHIKHTRRKKCVIKDCQVIWEFDWYEDESFLEFITCPLHRVIK